VLRATALAGVLGLALSLAPAAWSAAATPQEPAAQTPAPEKKPQAYTLSPEKREQAIAYSRARYRLYFFGFAWGIAALLVVLAARLAPRYRDWAERVSPRCFVQALLFAPLVLLTLDAFDLPLRAYGHALSLRYAQSVQGWGSWAWDWAKEEMISVAIGVFVVWILYGSVRGSPRRWWFYFWLASLPIIVFLVFLSPLVFEPLFFRFEPLEARQPQLVAEIERVVRRGGLEIPRGRMFEMEASEKLRSTNAYVSGLGASKRVVVWDTTLERMSVPQTLYVFGHEMGHYVLGHIPRTIGFLAVLLFAGLYLSHHAVPAALGCWGPRWGIRGADDLASLPVLLLFLNVLLFLSSPLINTYSRAQEHDADVYGLEVVHGIVPESSRAAAEAFQVLGEVNLSDPDPHPFIRFWLYTHPTIAERIAFARTYDPWSKGEPRKFVK
jgi:Zn-dependent protease with chaperone function